MAATNIIIEGAVTLTTNADGTTALIAGAPLVLTDTGITILPGAAAMNGGASVQFIGAARAAAQMDGVAAAAFIGTSISHRGVAQADGAGQVAFSGSLRRFGAAQMNGAALMVATSAPPPFPGIAQMDGAASMIATGNRIGPNTYNVAMVQNIINSQVIKSPLRMRLSIAHNIQLADSRVFKFKAVQGLLESFKLDDSPTDHTQYHYVFTTPIGVRPDLLPSWNAVLSLVQNLVMSQTTSQKFIWGRILTQALRVSAAAGARGLYKRVLAQLLKLSDIEGFSHTFPIALTQNINIHPWQANGFGLKLLQKLLVATSSSPVFNYHLALVGRVVVAGLIDKLFSAVLTQLFTVHSVLGRQFTANSSLAQLLTVSPAFTSKLVLQIVGNLQLSPSQLVKMIYRGDQLLDGVAITALYISPSGTTTTWAVNTRTNAVTEYLNYDFRSFALMGNRYVAAGSDGLYELDGDTDDGALIISEMMSGYLQLNEKKLFGIKGAYVAIRGGGRFYLKLVSGDGREYIYELKAQPNLMTTKKKVGKGIKTTYMAFELITEGQDFDLDSLEFIPMTSGRRV